MLLSAAGIAEIPPDHWASLEMHFFGSVIGFVGSGIILLAIGLVLQCWLSGGRYGIKRLLVWLALASVGLAMLQYGFRLKRQAEVLEVEFSRNDSKTTSSLI